MNTNLQTGAEPQRTNSIAASSRRQEALAGAHSTLPTARSMCKRASSRRLLRRLFLAVLNACLGGAVPAQAQTNCGACWSGVTNWQGTFNLSVAGSIQDSTGWAGTVNNSSQGMFWITNGIHAVHGTGSINVSASRADCCPVLGGCQPFTDTCGTAASGALDANGHVGVRIYSTNCTYTLVIGDIIGTVLVNNSTCLGNIQQSALGVVSCDLAQPAGVGLGILPTFPLPAFGQHLTGDGTYTAAIAATGCSDQGQFTLTLHWDIEPIIDSTPPRFTQLPIGGALGCNPAAANIPNAISILDQVAATAASGMVSIQVDSADVTNACTVTRSFTFTAEDECSGEKTSAVAAYWWTIDTTPPTITSVPVGTYLGCNPTNPPTDASVQGQALATDTCSAPAINVSHVDTTNGCAVTRTFSITATDGCGNVSPAKTVVYTWTIDTTPPTFTQLPAGGNLGTNPLIVPDDAAARAMTTVSDNCGVTSLTVTHADGGIAPQFSRTFTITAVDNCGNRTSATVVYNWTGTAGTGTGSAPLLAILRVGTNVVLSWTAAASGFSLQSATSLAAGNAWIAVTNIPVVVGNQYMVTNSATGRGRFYRLVN